MTEKYDRSIWKNIGDISIWENTTGTRGKNTTGTCRNNMTGTCGENHNNGDRNIGKKQKLQEHMGKYNRNI